MSFLVVTSTDSAAIDEARFFYEQLERSNMPFGALLVNRVRTEHLAEHDIPGLAQHILSVTPPLGDRSALERVARVAEEAALSWHVLARVDKQRLDEIRRRFASQRPSGDGARVVPIPLFQRDIHDVGSLARYAEIVVAAIEGTPAEAAPSTTPTEGA